MADDQPHMLDLEQFESLASAIEQVSDARVYERAAKPILERLKNITLLSLFWSSAITRLRAVHEAIVREMRQGNPYAVFPLLRTHAESVLMVAYVSDHPSYVETIAFARDGDLPKGKGRKPISQLIAHIESDAPGFRLVYDELCDITHFGSAALWMTHRLRAGTDRTSEWTSAPRWKREEDGLIACAQLKELAEAGTAYLVAFGQGLLDLDASMTER